VEQKFPARELVPPAAPADPGRAAAFIEGKSVSTSPPAEADAAKQAKIVVDLRVDAVMLKRIDAAAAARHLPHREAARRRIQGA
jgi:hypothetical protein